MPARAQPDPPLPPTFSAADALEAGLTRDQIRQRVRSGAWLRVAKGQYARSSATPGGDAHALARYHHGLRARALARRHPRSVIAFESAAVVHGLPLLGPVPDLVTLLVPPGCWTGIRGGARLRYADLPREQVMDVGALVTTPERTWIDIARTRSLAAALVVGDAGVRAGLFTPGSLRDGLDDAGSLFGTSTAHSRIAQLDGRRESPLESRSWAYFAHHRVPLPAVQEEFVDAEGLVGRADFWWADGRVVGESDGRLKYATADVLYAEKLREDRLRALGLTVVRWGSDDLRSAALADRLRSLLHSPARRVRKARRL